MGIVYRAHDPAIGRVVAIKTIRLNELAEPSERAKLRERLMREAQSAGILSHPGIVTIFDVGEQDGLAYISMEFVDGPTLERLTNADPPSGRLVLDILHQTAAALDYAHRKGIVHRDIKPANVMIHERTVAKITDFGVARIQSHQMTQAGSMIGTPNYMSPEQIQGQTVDGRSDQFSLAVIAYEMVVGERPFSGDSIAALAFKIVQEDPAPAHRLNSTLGWPVDTVLKRALSKKPEDRFSTCVEFAAAMDNACQSAKGWVPVSSGAMQTLPTMAAPAIPARPAPVIEDIEEAEPPETPLALRWARNLAFVVVACGVIAIGVMASLRWFDEELPAPGAVADETREAPQADKPSALGSASNPTPPPTAPERVRTITPPAVSPPETAPVRFITNPAGANLMVDGNPERTCKTPCSFDLPPGRHTIAATLDGHRRTLKIFELPGVDDVLLTLDPTTGSLVIRSEPRGASILVDGQQRREQTPAMLTLPTGRHRIEVVKDGSRETHEVVIQDAIVTSLEVKLPL